MTVSSRGLNGDLIDVASTSSRSEAEIVQELLRSGGIPCLLRPVGIDGPMVGVGLLPTSQHRIAVHAGQAEAARRVLSTALIEGEKLVGVEGVEDLGGTRRKPRDYGVMGAYARALTFSLGVLGVAFGLFLLLRA